MVCPLSRCFCFFFFNDTATTEIYTLSLHDALPILDDRGDAGVEHRRVRLRGARVIQDRKSTRLNSSHLGISYAVFCLKKKTKPRNGILSLTKKDKTVIYTTYMSFIKNGALFISISKSYKLCDEVFILFFFFNDTATTEIYTLSLHDALPISARTSSNLYASPDPRVSRSCLSPRSEEHTSELQSLRHLVCRLLLEKKKKK